MDKVKPEVKSKAKPKVKVASKSHHNIIQITSTKMKIKIRQYCALIAECISAVVTVTAILITIGCAYININERISGEMTFLAGHKLVYIESGSMEPAIKTGAVIIIRKAKFEDVENGDIITFETPEGYVTHRLVGEDAEARKNGAEAFLITKGDANSIEDIERLDPEDIRGVVVKIF